MMPSQYRRVAVIGAGPSGLAAVRALEQERAFDYIRVFERKSTVGGLWAYEADPAPFDPRGLTADAHSSEIPDRLSPTSPKFGSETPLPECMRGAAYEALDTNAGARTMAFTHTPLPVQNSIGSIRKFGRNNPSRPRRAVLRYLEDLFVPHLHLLVLNTSVEKVEKCEGQEGGRWKLTLRRRGISKDYWWQAMFDAVVVASGHFTVPHIPAIEGLLETWAEFPGKFEHSKSYRAQEAYVNKRVVVIGGGISAADLAEDLHDIVHGPLYISRRGEVGFLEDAWRLPNVVSKPTVKRISSEAGGMVVEFSDGTRIQGLDKIIFATGYKLSYPFLPFGVVTPENRLAGFYQHIFHMEDPSLAVIGQVRAAISFRIYEYQAVAVSRFLSGRSAALPSKASQREWETSRLAYKGPTELFHEIKPDFAEYYGWLREFAGRKIEGDNEPGGGHLLPAFDESWIQSDIEILQARQRHWVRVRAQNKPLDYDVPQHCL